MKYKSDILLGLSCAGVVVTAYEAMKLERRRHDKDLTRNELGLLYLPTFVSGGFTLWCMFAMHNNDSKNLKRISTGYLISSTTFMRYRNLIKEIIGDEDEAKIRASVYPLEGTYTVDNGKNLYYESFCKVPLTTTNESITKAMSEVNRILHASGSVHVSDLYYSLGVPVPKDAYDFGWTLELLEEFGSSWVDILKVEKTVVSKTGNPVTYYELVYSIEPMLV